MFVEKRRYPREETDMRLSLLLDDREVPVQLRNISRGGALVQIEKEYMDRVMPSDIGLMAKLNMQDGHSFTSPRGRILRCTETGDSKYVALELPTGLA